MSFELHHLPHVTSRLVRTSGRVFELWSPNSSQIPFFPGITRADFFPQVPRNPSERRYDGRVGVNDCIYTPQLRTWRTLTMLRLYPMFVDRLCSLSRELQTRMAALRLILNPISTTWENGPTFATVRNIEMLRRMSYWEEAVNLGVALQRSFREMDAWVSRTNIGGWFNGTSEDMVLRYMLARIPCLVIHEYQSDEMPRPSVRTFPNFLQNTEVESLLSDMNPYQQIARRAGLLDSITVGDDGRGLAPFATAEAERHSSSPRSSPAQSSAAGGPGLELGAPATPARSSAAGSLRRESSSSATPARALLRYLPSASRATTPSASSSSSMTIAPLPTPLTTRQDSAPARTEESPAPSSSTDNRFAVAPLERRTLKQGRVDWIVPPPIAQPNPKVKDWENWKLSDEFYGTMTWTAVGKAKAKSLSYERKRYDRNHKRVLHLDRYDTPPGVLEPTRFGEPVPSYPWIYPSGNKGIPKPVSRWMYHNREAKRWEVGNRAMVPSALSLPRIEQDTGNGATSRKGKAVATGAEDKDEEMRDVELPAEGVAASHIMVLNGLDADITAVMFREFARDAFWNADVDDYDEAARYSRDLWTPETTPEEPGQALDPSADVNPMEWDSPARSYEPPVDYASSSLPLAEHFPLHPAQRLIPLPLQLAPEDSLYKQPRLDGDEPEFEESVSPAKKRVRRGRRAGQVIQDAEVKRKAREAQAEALMDQDDNMVNEDFVEWVTSLDAVAEAEGGDDDEDPPIAGY
ncbi:hypothetical protein C8R44DRAFT_894796 [Mycena epipterygia]|nr:hypothetical protein C8R44DRAFT_894796 [Mycena epipterygia]